MDISIHLLRRSVSTATSAPQIVPIRHGMWAGKVILFLLEAPWVEYLVLHLS